MVGKRWRVWPAMGAGGKRVRAWAWRMPKQLDMGSWWANVVDVISSQVLIEEKVGDQSKIPGFLEAVEAARREWLSARAYFDNVTDADLVDHAIFTIEAAEKKYMYLLKQAREFGSRFDEERLPDEPQAEAEPAEGLRRAAPERADYCAVHRA